MHANATHVVVIGGGYAGVIAANRLTQRDDVNVTLVTARPRFVHRMRLHHLVRGSDEALVDYADILAPRIRLVVATVEHIDAAEHHITLESGDRVDYDYLIYALGSTSAAPSVPGVVEFAHRVADLEGAQRARSALERTPTTAPVTVIGAGATGIEVAAELAEEGRNVTLICGPVLNSYLHPRVRRKVARHLARLGVTVVVGPDARATAVSGDAVQLADGRTVPSTVTLWTVGFGVPDLASASGLRTDADGRLLTDETLTSVDDVRIVAAGDAASPSNLPLRMSVQSAMPLGAHAADTVLDRIAGREPAPIDIGLFFQCVSVGGSAATVQLASKQDIANRFSIGGRLAVKIKTDSYRQLIEVLAHEGQKPGSYRWRFKDRKRHLEVASSRGRRPDQRAVADPQHASR